MRVSPALTYDDAPAAIEFLCHAFGFRKRLVVPGENGAIMHSELTLGGDDVVIMVSSPEPDQNRVGPRGLPGVSSCLSFTIADPAAHYAHACSAGAEIMRELQDEEFGGSGYTARDPEGHQWYFGTYEPGAYWEDES